MDIAGIQLGDFRFNGIAGDLQARGSTASLIRELGDNYAQYHAPLAREFAVTGGRPDPADFDDVGAYMAACASVDRLLAAEALLRRCRGFRKLGRKLADDPGSLPYVDGRHRLVSAETGQAVAEAGVGNEAAWKPVEAPVT
jgi:hypothetical protein